MNDFDWQGLAYLDDLNQYHYSMLGRSDGSNQAGLFRYDIKAQQLILIDLPFTEQEFSTFAFMTGTK